MALTIIFFVFLIIINENGVYDYKAYIVMFGLGMLDNAWKTYENVIVGFEFTSKLTPFGATMFYESFAVFVSVACMS